MNLDDELTIIRSNLEDSALANDYPEIDDYIPFRTADYYLAENPEDYLRRIDSDNNYLPNENPFAGQEGNNEPVKYRANLPPEAYKEMADKIKKQDVLPSGSFGILRVISDIINLFKDLINVPKDRGTEYYYITFTEGTRPYSLIMLLLLVILYFVVI